MDATISTIPANGERAARLSPWGPAWQFAMALLRAGVARQNIIPLAVTLGTPLFILVTMWLTGGSQGLALVFPGLVAFGAMLPGQTHAIRTITWQQQGAFTRLACTPTPLGYLVLGASLAQVLLSVISAIGVLAFGVVVLGQRVNPLGTLAALLVLLLGAACFIAYGSLIASLTRRAEVAGSLFIFTLLPMSFIGGAVMPTDAMPAAVRAIGPWLPTGMMSNLLGALLRHGTLPDAPLMPIVGLIAYTVALAAIAAATFRLE